MKKCPFCASTATKVANHGEQDVRVYCTHCQAIGPSAGTEADAEECWNMRKTIPNRESRTPASQSEIHE